MDWSGFQGDFIRWSALYLIIVMRREQWPCTLTRVVLLLALAAIARGAYSCSSAMSSNLMNNYNWDLCYEASDGSVAGNNIATLSPNVFSPGGNWGSYDFKQMGFVLTNTLWHQWNCYTHYGTCRTDTDSCCCGCSRSCYNYQWNCCSYYTYDWSQYYCDDSDYIHVYSPCHPYCATCTSPWNNNYCQSCHHNFNNAYLWLNWGNTNYQKCDTTCPNQISAGIYTGQYIRAVTDLTCSWCHSTCSSCNDLSGGLTCRTCINTYYLLANYAECVATFPNAADKANCQTDYQCVTPCPNNLYFELSIASTSSSSYPWTANNADPLIRQTNICYLCHEYCFTCNQRFNYNCQACAAGYYKWQQYSNYCHRYCHAGVYTSGGIVGEFLASNAATTRVCTRCDTGCYYCSGTASTCYMCQDNYYLVDDRTTCISTYSTTSSYYASVTDGCYSRDKYCRPTDCPAYFYFKVPRTGTGSATDPKYYYFTTLTTDKLDNTANGYSSAAYPSNTNNPSPSPDSQYQYRNETNFCKLCHRGCIKCTGPTNFQCSQCNDLYYRWMDSDRSTPLNVCEQYCPLGQYRLLNDTNYTYAVRVTQCGACDWKCISCEVWRDNCTSCTLFPGSNYAFLFSYAIGNSTCLTTCPTSTAPLTQRGYYGSINTMICYPCPGGCSNCNIDKVRAQYLTLQDIVCKSDTYCSKGVECTTCLQGYSLVGGTCVSQDTCRLYSYYVQGTSSTTWSPSNCNCLAGNYFSSSTTCVTCHISCLTCSGTGSSNCLTCPPGYALSSNACVNSQVYATYSKAISGTSFSGSGYLSTSFNNISQCGTYYTLFGYQSGYTTGNYFYFQSPNYNYPNYYAINIRMKVLFIDQWDSTAGVYFRLGASNAYPFATYLYDTKGAIGEMQCGTNAYDYLLTLQAQTPVSPTGNNSYTVYVSSNKEPIQNLSGFYYHWGIHDVLVTVLQCHASCYRCTGPSQNQCTACWAADNKVLVGTQCLCNTGANYWYALNDPITAACIYGCPACTYTPGGASTSCYYRDSVKRMCVNPPTNNCSAPYSFAEPYELTSSYGSCRLNCSSGKFAYPPLMKCTTNCGQFTGYYHYDGGIALGANMSSCVLTCPMGLIKYSPTKWCVTRCPSGTTTYFLALENRSTDPYCTSNCTTGREYDLANECVDTCPSGYFTQTLSLHNKCVQTCSSAFGDNITRSCVQFCPTPSFADPNTHLCADECTNGYYEQIAKANGNRTCVSVCQNEQWLHPYYLNCSKNPMDCLEGTFADNYTHSCLTSCNPAHDEVGENSTRMCQKQCNTGYAYWAAGLCVLQCPSTPSLWAYVGTKRICVSSCNSSTTGLYADAQANRTCVATCSKTPIQTFGDYDTNLCEEECTNGKFGNPYHPNRLCVTSCVANNVNPLQTYSYYVTKQCLSVCPAGYYGDAYTTAGQGVCDTNCPTGYFGDPTINLCVARCPYRYYGIPTGDRLCAMVCPYGYYGINQTSNRLCVLTCDSGYWADNYTSMCYNVKTQCSNGTYADKQLKYCVIGQSCTPGTYADPLTMGCEANCTNATMFGDPSTNLCVNLCPSSPDYFSQYGYCKGTCLDNMYRDYQANRSCVATCSTTPVPLYGTIPSSSKPYRCVAATQCWTLDGLFGHNTTRKCQTCSGDLPFGDPVTRQCVFNCPPTYYGDTGSHLCVLHCDFSLKLYADNATYQCTLFCTLGTFGVNSTGEPLCQRECPAGSYALDSNRVCMSDCGVGFFGDPLTGKCYASALNCSQGYFGNTVTHMCVLPTYCQTSGHHYYADNDTKLCITKCNSPFYGLNTSYTCELTCPQPYFAENTTRICLIKSDCGVFRSFADDQINVCVSQCSAAPVFTFAENVTHTCVVPADCPTSMFADNLTQSCVYYCPHNISYYAYADEFKTKRCLNRCFDVYYGEISSGHGICNFSCPGNNYYRDNRTQTCVYVCPAANTTLGYLDTYGDSTTDQCVTQCASGWFAQTENSQNRTCVQVCMEGTWGNQITGRCIANPVTDCPQGTWADNFTHLCASTCTFNSSNGQLFYGQNQTKLCVSSCPVPTFAFTGSLVCIDICPVTIANSPGYFGDPNTTPTRLCVTKCLTAGLYRDKANNRTCQPSCTFNSTYKLYKDPTAMTCVAECPSYPQYLYAWGANSSQAECLSSCPSGHMLDNNMSCVTTCPGLLDPTTNRCVQKCPFNSALNSTLFADLTAKLCVVSASCPSNTYASDDLLECVSSCPNGTYISGKDCVSACPDGQYIDTLTASCVAAKSCSASYYGNNQTRACVLVCTNGTFADTNTKMCLSQCYSPNYGDPLTGKCASSCSNGLIKQDLTRSCVAECDPGYFFYPTNTTCLTECLSPYFADSTSKACVSKCSSDPVTFAATTPKRQCVTTCPTGAPWYDMINRVCTATCPTNTYMYSVNVSCLAYCPPPYYLLGTSCNTSCSSASLYADDTTRKCISYCPLGYYKDPTTFKCVMRCPISPVTYFAYDSNRTCLAGCPSGSYADTETFKCVSSCSTNPVVTFAEPNSNRCVFLCPAAYNEFADTQTQKCTTTCTSGYFADNRQRMCLKNCSTYFADSLTTPPACVSTCTSSTFADPLTFKCSTSCPSGYYAHSPNATCLQFCPYGYYADPYSKACVTSCRNSPYLYADPLTHLCTAKCSNGQYAHRPSSSVNGSCLYYCPSSYFSDPGSMSCLLKCPNGLFGETINNTCMETCSEDKYQDSVNNLCQNICPSANGLFGQPYSRKCVTNCSNSGKTFLYADSDTRKCTDLCSGVKYADPPTLTCVAATSCSSGLVSDGHYKMCVARCYNRTYAYQGSCYSACPVTTLYADEASQSCVLPSSCAVGLYADPSKGRCLKFCDISSNRYADDGSRTCVLGCSSPLFSDNVTRRCVAKCSSAPQYYGLNSSRLCQQNCPTNTFGDPILNLCVLKCSDGLYGDKLTWTCVSLCPRGYFGDNSTNLCVQTCPSSTTYNYFGDPFTSTCVYNCSNKLYADPLTNRECVSTCASPNFSQNQTATCLDSCLTGYANPTTRQCVAVCSKGYYGFQRVCYSYQCPSATPLVYADDSTNLCTTQCPLGTYGESLSRKCVSICPIGSNQFADTVNRVCRSSCLSGTYADYSLRACVSRCSSSPALYSYTIGNICVENCQNGLFADNATRSCTGSCPNGTYADNSTYRCVFTCPSKPMMWGNPLINYCVYRCSDVQFLFADNNTRICTKECTNGTFADQLSRMCLSTCPSGYYAVNSTKTCNLTCPAQSFADPLSRICVAKCPVDPKYFGDQVGWACRTACPGTSVGNPLTQRCVYYVGTVSGCPEGYFAQLNSDLCVEVCPMKLKLYAEPASKTCKSACVSPLLADNSTMRCVSRCPTYPNYYASAGKCVFYCSATTYADNFSRSCLPVCPNGTYADNSTWRCIDQCTRSPLTFRDSLNWKCVSRCPPTYYADYFNLLCVQQCPLSGDGFARNDTQQCVKQCPNSTFAYLPTRICVLKCYSNTFANELQNRCVDICPRYPARYADNTTMSCVSKCPTSMFAFDNTRECVYTCPDPAYFRQNSTGTCVKACNYSTDTYSDNITGYCVLKCSNGTFADPSTKQCVSSCPNQPRLYAENITQRCIPVCPDNSYGQNKTRTCVLNCPSGSLSYPQNHLCVFECPTGYYAYTPTQFCLDRCPSPYYGDPSTRTCVDSCPINQLLYADNSSNTCVKRCPPGSYAYQWSVSCLASCPLASPPYVQTYAADYDNTCTEQCDYPYFSYLPTFKCVSSCPDPYYNKVDSHICQLCPTSCTSCSSATNCKGCVLGFYLQNGICVTTCSLIYYANPDTRKCVVSNYCKPYFGVNETNKCSSSCPTGQYPNTAVYRCDLCPSTCLTCLTPTNCPSCVSNSVAYNNYCYGYCNTTLANYTTEILFSPSNLTCTELCPNGSYSHIVFCLTCSPQCLTCTGTASNCTNCTNGRYIFNNTCVSKCPDKYKPVISRACLFCNDTCGSGLTYQTNITNINGQTSMFVNFNQGVDITGNLYSTFSVTTGGRRLLQTSTPSYQIVVIDANTVQIIFPPGTSQTNFNLQITNPQNIIGPNGELPSELTSTIALDVSNQYSTSVATSPSSFSTYFTFLALISVISFLFDLELMRFLQLIYVHYFVIMALPPHLFKVLTALRFSTLHYLPTLFSVSPAVLHPSVPDTVYNAVGDYNFLRNTGFALTPLVAILLVWGILKLLSVPEINRFKNARVWCRQALENRFKYAVILEWVFMFITSMVFFAFLQLRDYNLYDSFAQAGLIFAHLFILLFVVIAVLVAYRVVAFHREHPQMSENIKKASQLILKDEEADQLVSTNVFLSEKKKIDLRDIYYPQINNENIFPFRCVYKYTFLALLCPNVLYLRVILLSAFIALANSSVQLQMSLAIPLNVLALLYFSKSRPYTFKFKKYRIKNYIVIFHEVALIIFEFLLLILGIKNSSGVSSNEKELFGNFIIYYLTAVCTVSFLYQIFIVTVFIYRKIWLKFIETEFFAKNFPEMHAKYQAAKNKGKKLAKSIDPKAKQALKNLIKGYKKTKSALRPSQDDKANPQLPVKYKITYFDRSETSSLGSRTTLSKKQKKQMLKELFGQAQETPKEEEDVDFQELRDESETIAEPEYEEYQEEIEIKAKDLAKYVSNSDNLLKMKKTDI